MSDETWRQIEDAPDAVYLRIAWARTHLTEFTRPIDAARALHIKPVTYRTYEVPKWEGGRIPPVPIAQSIAKKFGVSWAWLVSGKGSPYETIEPTPLMVISNQLAERLEKVPEDKRQDALRAVEGVLAAFDRQVG